MNNYKIQIKWGIFTFIFILSWVAMERLIGLHEKYIYLQPTLTGLASIPLIFIIYLFYKDKKINFYNNNMNFTQGLESGFSLCFINLLLSPLYQWIIFNFITPDYFKNSIYYYVSRMKMTQMTADNYFNFTSFMNQSLLISFTLGVVFTIVFSFFMRTTAEDIDE